MLNLGRRAKYLVMALEGDLSVIAHLGMSGSFRIEEEGSIGDFHHARSKDRAHDHVIFILAGEDGSDIRIVYNDPRRFGFMDLLTASQRKQHPVFTSLGLEPLSPEFDGATLARVCRGRKTSLKVALLDQRLVAGIGNIYASEALHIARLSPLRRAGLIATPTGAPRDSAHRLAAAIKQVLNAAIARANGRRYRSARFRVYDRDGEPCLRAGCDGVIRRATQAGRSTFYCPVCQR